MRYMRGNTIIEVLGMVAIGVALTFSLTTMIDKTLVDTRAQQAALYQAQVAAAAAAYLGDHYADLTSGPLAATDSMPAVGADLAKLIDSGYLASGFADRNAYGQRPCLLVLQPSPGKLFALLVTEQGDPIPSDEIGYAAVHAGQGGGYIKADAEAGSPVAAGAVGGFQSWQLDAAYLSKFAAKSCSGTPAAAGHFASALYYDGPEASDRKAVYRNAMPGHPELNTVSAAPRLYNLQLAGITEGMTVLGGDRPDLQCSVADISTWGRIAADEQGNILSCQSGIWRRQGGGSWKEAVDGKFDLPADGNTDGDVRLVRALHKAYSWNAEVGRWLDLDTDKDDNIYVANRLTTPDIVIQRTSATIGDSCASEPSGTVARESGGAVVSCQQGAWQTLTSGMKAAASDVDCAVILPSSYVANPKCANAYSGALDYDGRYNTWTAIVKRLFTPTADGLIVANARAEMNLRDPYSSGSEYNSSLVVFLDVIDNDTGAVIESTHTASPLMNNDAATPNSGLVKAVGKNVLGYTVQMRTTFFIENWNYDTKHGSLPDNSRRIRNELDKTQPCCVPIVENETPLTAFWSMELLQ